MSALADIVAAVDPTLREHAVAAPGGGRFDGPHAFVLEAVYEGYLLHYRVSRVFSGMDDDLRLLAGDALYALGLKRLARSGDLGAVAELGDLISLCARAEAEARRDLVEPLWEATVRRLEAGGCGARAEVVATGRFSA